MSDHDDLQATAAPPRARELTWTDASGFSRRFVLGGAARITIGRGSGSDLVIRDTRISRQHATIELVQGQHFLRDLGSANGTFLNGLRLTPGSAFALRSGDTIEVGGDRFAYDKDGDTPPAEAEGACFALADLVADGEKDRSARERRALEEEVMAAVRFVPLADGLGRVLAIVAARLAATSAACFLEDREGRLRAWSARPQLDAAASFHALAERARLHGEGRLLFATTGLDEGGSTDDTLKESHVSTCAVPFAGPRTRGVLAAARASGERLSVRSVALLATIGVFLGRALG